MDLTPYRTFTTELAERSGDFIRPHFANPALTVETKSDASPVTAADRGAEELLRVKLGSKAFITGVPLWGTLIALLHQGQPVLGCIHQPILRQLMLGDGTTTTLNGRTVRCRATTRLADATLLTSDTLNLAKYQNGPASDRLLASAKLVRTWGDCYGYLLVASGWADLSLDPIMNPWDIAALVPVIRGAGGVITDWNGGAAYPATSTVAAATPELHAAALAILATR